MPRTTRGRGSRTAKSATRVSASGSQASRVQTRSQGSTVAGQKRRNVNPRGASRPKRGRAIPQDTETENDAPTTPLTQADIPQIVEAVLNNLSAPHETTHDDDSHTQDNLGKPVTSLCVFHTSLQRVGSKVTGA